ncbi:DUF2637 domain-containing protein [Streptomyces canus]|uniref:DUF2637 domain-containing protein n=1 Tax=Streptomyces canus TaxID=58343 RepID=UPI00277E6EA5|nr:DUF2637 domain-containing protein [Streptomyces canus]MDQ0760934.1 hypothetical protein [Streptomyces canus]MDQ1070439.1 hypothetical protein [Streptomyces canus]
MHERQPSYAFRNGQVAENLHDAWMNSPRRTAARTVPDRESWAPGNLHVTASWDPAEELAHLLQAQTAEQELAEVPLYEDGFLPEQEPVFTPEGPAMRPRPPAHRRIRTPRMLLSRMQTVSFLVASMASVIVAMVSVFSGIVAYDPLREVATGVPAHSVADRWWPLMVYGPWMVSSLSVLRAALHRRRAAHSWCIVMFFSAVAMALCVIQAPRTLPGIAAAALPAIAALTCFHQLVRQITLTRPPRKAARRHRDSSSSSKQASADL